MSRRALILILLVSTWNLVRGVTTAPVLLRACLDNTTNVITIQYSSITDACGSFVDHQIFGSETGSSYQLMHTETDFSANTVQFVLPNGNPTWSFYFETRFLCDGSSIATSNTISIDITKPSETAIDSVSIDLTTQRLVVGWKKNTTPDTKGYRIYRSVNGVNSVIGDTASTHYIVHNQGIPLNSVITLATFDSCDLFSTISDGHRAMSLSSDLDTCTRTVNLSWSRYMGWSIDQQDLYYSTNGSAYTAMPLDAATASHSFPGLNFGDSVCFFVRARNLNPVQRTSSSNVTCAKLLKPVLPKLAYLSQVTVENNSTIKIEALVDNQGVSDSVILYRDASPPVRVGGRKLADGSNFYTWNDNKVSVSTRSETYFVRTFAPCLGGTLTSNSSPSIHLSIDDDELLVWNSYTGWEGDVLEYRVYGYDGSTWNIISSTSELNYQNDDTTLVCFRIEAVENQNSHGFFRTSISNEVCAKRPPRFFVPNTLNPLSHNNRLVVIGPSIDKSRSTMSVFNRWGEVIFTTDDVEQGWSVDAATTFIPLGIYFYDVALFDLNGNKHRLSGSVRVIR